MGASSSAPTVSKGCILGIDVGKDYTITGSCDDLSLDNNGFLDSGPLKYGVVSGIMRTKNLFGRKFSDPVLPSELHSYLVKDGLGELNSVTEGSDGFPLLKYQGELVSTTELVAKNLSQCKDAMAQEFKIEKLLVSDCCVGIPLYFTYQQRRELLHVIETVGLKSQRLLHWTTAIALGYRFSFSVDKYPMNVAFIDTGYCGMQISIVEIKTNQLKVLSHAHDESLGERAFTDVLFKYLSAKFEVNTSDMKIMVELHRSCENLKEELNSKEVASFCYLNFNVVIKRTEFEDLCSTLLERVNVLLKKALRTGLAVKNVHETMMIGGGSKIPAVKNIFQEFFNKEPRKWDRWAASFGCLIQCAMLCGASKIPDFQG